MTDRANAARLVEIGVAALALVVFAAAMRIDRPWFEMHLTQSFCALERGQLHRLAAVRSGAVLFAALLVFVVRPLAKEAAAAMTPRELALAMLRTTGAVVLALLFTDVVLRRSPSHATLPPPSLPPLREESFLGWAGKPNVSTTLRADDREIDYELDLNGYRAPSRDRAIDPDQPSILFAGESITEGVGVTWDESFPARVARELDVQAVEAAVHGYGDDQIHWAAEKELAVLRRPVAVVTFMIPQLLERDLDETRPRWTLASDGALVRVEASPQAPAWWRSSPLRRIARGLFPYHDDSSIALARALFAATARDARAKGAYPLVVLTNWGPPCLPPPEATPALSERLFGGLDVPFVEVRLDPASIEHSTFHPDAAAHRVLADAIVRALADARVAAR